MLFSAPAGMLVCADGRDRVRKAHQNLCFNDRRTGALEFWYTCVPGVSCGKEAAHGLVVSVMLTKHAVPRSLTSVRSRATRRSSRSCRRGFLS